MTFITSKLARYTLAIIALAAGVLLVTTKVDRQVLVLQPSEGAAYAVPMNSKNVYSQTFVFTRNSLSRVSFYFNGTNLPVSTINLEVLRGNTVIGHSQLSTTFINTDDASGFSFSPSLPVTPGEVLQANITIPAELNNLVRLRTRQSDGSFKASDTVFTINNEKQPNSLGYQADYGYRLPFAVQLGFLFIMGAVYLVVPPRTQTQKNIWLLLSAIAASFLFALPAFLLGAHPWLLVIAQATVLLGMFAIVAGYQVSPLAAMFGAIILAFCSWFSLQYSANHPYFFIVAPLLAFIALIFYRRSMGWFWIITLTVGILITGTLAFALPSTPLVKPAPVAAHFQDVFLDTNQSPAAQKFPTLDPSTTWDHFGSYVGIPAFIFIVIGFLSKGKRYWRLLVMGIAFAAIAFVPFLVTLLNPISPQTTVIAFTVILAFFAAQGFESVYTFLGKQYKLVPVMMATCLLIVLLDLFTVSATILEYPLIK